MTERELEKLNHGRLLREAARELLPLLVSMKDTAVARIIMAHKEGQPEKFAPLAAELSVISDLSSKISRSNKETELTERKLYGSESGSAEI